MGAGSVQAFEEMQGVMSENTNNPIDMPAAEHPTCGQCRFWDPFDDAEGECRRHSPAAILYGMQASRNDSAADFHAAWPVTGAADWCGEFVARPHTGAMNNVRSN